MENKKLRACRAVAALSLAAVLAACGGGGGGGGGSPSSTSTVGGSTGTSTGAAGTPGTATLSDVGAYPSRPTTISVGASGSSSGGTSSGGSPGSTGGGTSGTGTTGSGTGASGTGTGTSTGAADSGVPSAGSSGVVAGGVALPPYVPTGPKVLVLYDSVATSQWQKLGFSYAIMVRNLLGHFDAAVDLVPVQNYAAGQVAAHDATFYLGSEYDNPLPASFLADASASSKPLVWFKYNLWELSENPAYPFKAAHGMTVSELRGMNAQPTAAAPSPGFFDTVQYKGLAFVKYYNYNAQTGAINAEPEIGVVTVTDSTKVSVVVPIRNATTGEQLPYVARSGNFWYVADMPFSYIGPRDRYLVFADLLHDMLGVQHAESHKAMVRLEDVGAQVTYSSMQRLTDFLQSRSIRFSVAVMPHFKDPLGVTSNGVPQDIPLAQATTLRRSLDYATARGGEIVMHGYTHQYAAVRNPWSGVSGDDYEFWDIVHNTPVAEDSSQWALDRVTAGLRELTQFNYGPVAWETPHYVSSPLASKAFPLAFDTTYQRVVYFTADKPNLTAASGKDIMAGQIFPYPIARDYYGQRVLPENLGNIEYDISKYDPSSNLTYTSGDILLNARYALAVRDGFASFFFHPFWIEREVTTQTGQNPYQDFTSLVQGITNLGYTWVAPSMLRP
jgi:uncharacterized protein YdaL